MGIHKADGCSDTGSSKGDCLGMRANSGTAVSTDAGACVVAGDGTVDYRSGAVGSRAKHAAGWVLAKDSGVGEDDDSGGSVCDVRDGTDGNCPDSNSRDY